MTNYSYSEDARANVAGYIRHEGVNIRYQAKYGISDDRQATAKALRALFQLEDRVNRRDEMKDQIISELNAEYANI
jgi:hypothetical protein